MENDDQRRDCRSGCPSHGWTISGVGELLAEAGEQALCPFADAVWLTHGLFGGCAMPRWATGSSCRIASLRACAPRRTAIRSTGRVLQRGGRYSLLRGQGRGDVNEGDGCGEGCECGSRFPDLVRYFGDVEDGEHEAKAMVANNRLRRFRNQMSAANASDAATATMTRDRSIRG